MMLPDHSEIFDVTAVFFYIMILLFSFSVLIIGIFFVENKVAVKRFLLLRFSFIMLMKGKSDEVAKTIQVPNLVGDAMDVDVPLYRIEQVRRLAVKTGDPDVLLWLSILVCTAYEDVISFKNEIVEIMEKDLESVGRPDLTEKLASLCRYPISSYLFFRIINCILMKGTVSNSLFDEIRKNSEMYKIPKNLTTIGRFNIIVRHLKYFGLVITGFFLSSVLLVYGPMMSQTVLLILLSILTVLILLIILVILKVYKQCSRPLECGNIEQNIMSEIPGFRIRPG